MEQNTKLALNLIIIAMIILVLIPSDSLDNFDLESYLGPFGDLRQKIFPNNPVVGQLVLIFALGFIGYKAYKKIRYG